MQNLTPGQVFAKDYKVVRILAQGGMGAVYEAEPLEGGASVALKLMHPSQVSDPKLRRRFAQEARVGAWIGSEHIVEVSRAGIDEESHIPWLVMELLQGETLASRLQRYAPSRGLPHDDAWKVLSQLCRALIAAHEKNVIHRDLKPENVFLTKHARDEAPFTVKILDFGIAKRLNPNNPSSNRTSAIGTPLWMAPEQNEDTELSPAADVWAAGLLCFRMFTGRFYWLSANEPDLNLGWLYSELVTEPLFPASQRAEMLGCETLLPKGFDAWFARCVVRDPKARFANAREMTDALVAIAPPVFAPYARTSILPAGTSQPEELPSIKAPAPTKTADPAAATVPLRAPPPSPMAASPENRAPVSAPPVSRPPISAPPVFGAAPLPGAAPMSIPAPQSRPASPSQMRSRVVVIGLALAVLLGGVLAWWTSLGPSTQTSNNLVVAPPEMPQTVPVGQSVGTPAMPMQGMPVPGMQAPSGPAAPGMVPVEPAQRGTK